MPWLILRTAIAREKHLERLATMQGIEADCPMDIRSKAVSRHTRRRLTTETPLIPRVLFLKAPGLPALPRHALGYVRDITGAILAIPDREYARFKDCHTAWLLAQTNAHRQGNPGKPRKPITRRWGEKNTFQDIMRDLFGIEILEDAA